VPGYNQRIVRFCLRFGNFRPRFVSIGVGNSLEEGLVISANEGAVSLQPSFISHLRIPNVVMVPIAEKRATWIYSSHGKEGERPTLCVLCWTVFNSRPSLKARPKRLTIRGTGLAGRQRAAEHG
jgi:hypothetical protein